MSHTRQKSMRPGYCPECDMRHVRCALKEECPKWEQSYHVGLVYGMLPLRSDMAGAASMPYDEYVKLPRPRVLVCEQPRRYPA